MGLSPGLATWIGIVRWPSMLLVALALALAGAGVGVLLPLVGLFVVLDVEPIRLSDVLVFTALPICIGCARWVHYRLQGPSSLLLLGLLVGLDAAVARAVGPTMSHYMLPGVVLTMLASIGFTALLFASPRRAR